MNTHRSENKSLQKMGGHSLFFCTGTILHASDGHHRKPPTTFLTGVTTEITLV
jgi:hypothetical protein